MTGTRRYTHHDKTWILPTSKSRPHGKDVIRKTRYPEGSGAVAILEERHGQQEPSRMKITNVTLNKNKRRQRRKHNACREGTGSPHRTTTKQEWHDECITKDNGNRATKRRGMLDGRSHPPREIYKVCQEISDHNTILV